MSQLDDLLARSRAPGRFVERRHFTLSREKAIEKQREFALRHPKQYILELVQAAVFAGATYIAIDSRPHSVLVAWVGGERIADKQLENLLDYLFADRGDARWRHLVQLAVGVNAILQRKPRLLRIETGDGRRSVRMDLDHRGQADIGVVEQPIAGTYLHAEYGGGWLARFTKGAHTEEQGLVEERCLYTPVPILLNGGAPFGYRGSRQIEIFGARQQVHFDEGGRRGVVAIHASPRAPTGFRMVVGGVWVTTLPLAEIASQPLVGVICDDRLRKTADHSDVVQDHRYVEMLHAVQPHATQLLRAAQGTRYVPPFLPATPKVKEKPGESTTEVSAEPLPQVLPMLHPRAPVRLEDLKATLGAEAAATPLFWATREVAADLDGGAADPVRFPYRVALLSPGQAVALEAELPGVPVHRLTGKADVEFVRRVLERQVRIREHVEGVRGGALRLRLHVEGAMPDWAAPAGGDPREAADGSLPWAVVEEGETRLAGVVEGAKVVVTAFVGDRPSDATLAVPVRLPRVSLVLERAPGSDAWAGGPDDATMAQVLDLAWKLAVPEQGEPHRPLLCAILGQVAVPQLQSSPGLQLAASLPHGAPDALRHIPLLDTREGPLSLDDFVALMGTDRAVGVQREEDLAHLDALEARFGYGHLTHPQLEGRPVFGVGRIGPHWVWLDRPSLWTAPNLTQMIWVASTFAPRLSDASWETESHPRPELVAARRRDVEGVDWEGGWNLLYARIHALDADDAWATHPGGASERTRGMGRLALLHLATMLGRLDQPLLLPSDGGARRSLRELREDPAAAVVARNGVEVAEPWTFLLTRDELRAVQGERPIALRYDDHPEVWRSLTEGPETGWLLRQEVRQAGLNGWLGLRHPYDGTTGILVRTSGRLIALPEMDRRIPCHGLLWPVGGGRDVTGDQVDLLQLAGLRLYQDLAGLLRSGLDPERTRSATLYGFAFARLAHRRGRLSGTALELARLVQIHDESGALWGPLERWLETPADERPPRPAELVHHDLERLDAPPTEELDPVERARFSPLRDRLRDALGPVGAALHLTWGDGGRAPPVQVVDDRSRLPRAVPLPSTIVLLLNQQHPLVAASAGGGRELEALLLEAARQVCAWTRSRGLGLDLLEVQQVLLAQRFAGPAGPRVGDAAPSR